MDFSFIFCRFIFDLKIICPWGIITSHITIAMKMVKNKQEKTKQNKKQINKTKQS